MYHKTKGKSGYRPSAGLVWTVVVLITCFAAVIRLYKLGEWSFWVDEMFTLQDSTHGGALGLYHGGNFPLSYMLISLSIGHFGVSEWSLRIVPAIFGILTPAMIYLLARKSFGELTSFIAACIIAISPWHLYWSQMARFYTMTLFFTAASIFMLHHALETNRKWLAAVAGVLMTLGLFSHYSSMLVVAGIVTYAVFILFSRWQKPQGYGLVNAALFVVPILIGWMIIGSRAGGLLGKYAAGHPTGTVIAGGYKAAIYVMFSTGYRLEPVIAFLALIGVGIAISKRDRGLFLMCSAAIIPLLLLIVAGIKSHAENRYLFIILPPVAILAARAISSMMHKLWEDSRILAIAVPIVVALPMLLHDASYFKLYNGERWNYRAAAVYLSKHAREGDTVYSSMPISIDYYLRNSRFKVQDLNAEEKLPSTGDWLVMEDETRGESTSKELEAWLSENCQLYAHFPASSPMADYGLSVYRKK